MHPLKNTTPLRWKTSNPMLDFSEDNFMSRCLLVRDSMEEQKETLFQHITNEVRKYLHLNSECSNDKQPELISFFLFGSRLYDVHKPESDWDSHIIVRNLASLNLKSTTANPSKGNKPQSFIPGLIWNREIMEQFEVHLIDVELEVPPELNPYGRKFIKIDLNLYDINFWRELLHHQVDCKLVILLTCDRGSGFSFSTSK